MSIYETIAPAPSCDSLWNLIPQYYPASFEIARLGFAITVGFTSYKIIIRIIQSLISKYCKRRTPEPAEDPDLEMWMQEFILFLRRRPRAEVEQFLQVFRPWVEMPEELQYAYFRREFQRIFGIEIETRPRIRTRGL